MVAAAYLLADPPGVVGLAVLAAHVVMALAGMALAFWRFPGSWRAGGVALAVATLILGLTGLAPWGRGWATTAHVVAGILVMALAAEQFVRLKGRVRLALGVLTLGFWGPLAGYGALSMARANPASVRYDPEGCYRFLTATTVEQSGAPNFPSALRVAAEGGGCQVSGCHADIHAAAAGDPHASAGSNGAYRAVFADFIKRRGEAAGRWCQGCHNPESQRGPTGAGASGVTCVACHATEGVEALHGSSPLRIGGGESPDAARLETLLRPGAHARRNLHGGLVRSSEFCAGCHRKNWNIPQNEFHWMAGQDEYRQWQTSGYSGSGLYAAGEEKPKQGCVDCHAPHGAPRPAAPYMSLNAFVRRQPPGTGSAFLDVDVLVRNTGIGHDFPHGQPDLYDNRLVLEAFDAKGKPLALPGRLDPSRTATYGLRALDRQGERITRGDLDRMTQVAEWRRIPAGDGEVVRYRLPRDVRRVNIALVRSRRAAFSQWAGEPVQQREETLASASSEFPTTKPDTDLRRAYGAALSRAGQHSEAIATLNEALKSDPADAETILALGRAYYAEGDLVAAGEQFNKIRSYGNGSSDAWAAAVLRRSGQPEEAVKTLEPLAHRHPRDIRLRFELGRALMDLLRHEEAAAQFRGMLDADPLDASAHFNLMLCLQRLNRFPEARREEALYKLLSANSGREGGDRDAAPLRVFDLTR